MARPREFDEENVLDAVTDLFWKNGYEAVSVRDIADATGVRMASLYAAFGDKRGLYRAALEHYERTTAEPALAALAKAGEARERIAKLLQIPIDAVQRGDRRGCFLCNAAIDIACDDDETTHLVGVGLKRVEDAFAAALADHPYYDKSAAARRRAAQRLLADYLGMRVLARSGASAAALRNIRSEILAAL